jgi:hypothetical protein
MLKVFKFLSDGYPEYKLAKFRAEWSELDDASKEQIKAGVENGTLTY